MDVRALPVLRLHSTLHVAALLLLPIGSNQYPELFLTEPDPGQALEKGESGSHLELTVGTDCTVGHVRGGPGWGC